MCTHAIEHEVKHFANRKSAILASDMAPVVTGPKRTNKKGEYIYKLSLSPKENPIAAVLTGPHWSDRLYIPSFERTCKTLTGLAGKVSELSLSSSLHLPLLCTNEREMSAFNQNPVFSVLADDGASTPGRDRQSPSQSIYTAKLRQHFPLTSKARTNCTLGSARGGPRGKPTSHAKSIIADYPSDTDRTRSASPPGNHGTPFGTKSTPNMRINTLLNDETPTASAPPVKPGRGNWSRNRANAAAGGRHSFKPKFEAHTSQDGTSPSTNAPAASLTNGPHGFYLPLNGSDPTHKRSRPLTQHQLAVEQYRKRRVDVILDRGLRAQYRVAKRRRVGNGAIWSAWLRCKTLHDGYDTDEDSNIQAQHQMDMEIDERSKSPPPLFGGLLPNPVEADDGGEEAYIRAKIMGRVARRLERWEGGVEAVKRKKKNGAELVWVDRIGRGEDERMDRGDSQMGDYEGGDGDEELDEAEREMLGEVDADESDEDEDQEMEGARDAWARQRGEVIA